MAFTHNSIADIHEASLIKTLMADLYWRSSLLGIEGIPAGTNSFLSVPLCGVPRESQGDIDILLSVPGRPDLATAIQVKRIKVGALALQNQTPNKLQELKKGVRQANALSRIGFWLVYLYVFVVVDSRERNAGKNNYEGLPRELSSFIERQVSTSGLDTRVGLMHYEFVQPMDYQPLGVGSSFARLVRLGEPVIQPAEVTAWVAQVTTVHPPFSP